MEMPTGTLIKSRTSIQSECYFINRWVEKLLRNQLFPASTVRVRGTGAG